jgi:hypothetical protein
LTSCRRTALPQAQAAALSGLVVEVVLVFDENARALNYDSMSPAIRIGLYPAGDHKQQLNLPSAAANPPVERVPLPTRTATPGMTCSLLKYVKGECSARSEGVSRLGDTP